MKWYEDKEYQKMCEGAEELRSEKIRWGDFYLLNGQLHLWSGKREINPEHRIKLHSQEDLQEMVKNYQFHIWTGHDGLCLAVSSSNQDQHFIGRKFTSMPKLWLAFVLHELWQKRWNAETKKWENLKSEINR